MADPILGNVFANAGMVNPPMKTTALGMPPPKQDMIAVNMAVPNVSPSVRAQQIRDLSK